MKKVSIVAYLLAPALSVISLWLVVRILGGADGFVMGGLSVFVPVYVASLVFGPVIHFVLWKAEQESVWTYLLAGGVAGCVWHAAVTGFAYEGMFRVVELGLFAANGGFIGGVFALIKNQGRMRAVEVAA